MRRGVRVPAPAHASSRRGSRYGASPGRRADGDHGAAQAGSRRRWVRTSSTVSVLDGERVAGVAHDIVRRHRLDAGSRGRPARPAATAGPPAASCARTPRAGFSAIGLTGHRLAAPPDGLLRRAAALVRGVVLVSAPLRRKPSNLGPASAGLLPCALAGPLSGVRALSADSGPSWPGECKMLKCPVFFWKIGLARGLLRRKRGRTVRGQGTYDDPRHFRSRPHR